MKRERKEQLKQIKSLDNHFSAEISKLIAARIIIELYNELDIKERKDIRKEMTDEEFENLGILKEIELMDEIEKENEKARISRGN